MTAPLQLVIFRHLQDQEVAPFEEAIVRAFQGGKEAGQYLVTGEDLGIQLSVFDSAPVCEGTPAKFLDGFCHSLLLVLLDHELLKNAALWPWLEEAWQHVQSTNGRHGILVISMEERIGRSLQGKSPGLSTLQLLEAHTLAERAIRPAVLALRSLHESRVLLAGGLQASGLPDLTFLRLFISHAKIDGLPLALALKNQIQSLTWLKKFYDADDLPAGSNWQQELEKGVASSLIVMLRTDVYDSRYWCQQEVVWADEYATPAVLVDARTRLQYSAGVLPLDRVPSVRIPDGNLMRILFLALRESLRFLYFIRRVEEMKLSGELPTPVVLRVFSFAPSMAALLRACRVVAASAEPASTPRMIIYPDPPLRTGLFEAAETLVAAFAPTTRLLTPHLLATTRVSQP